MIENEKLWYTAIRLWSWKDVAINIAPGFHVEAAEMLGSHFIPVFESAEEAIKQYPNAEIVIMRSPATIPTKEKSDD